jgi:hypothetical protein
MSTTETPEYQAVRETVARWSPAQRFALIHEMLNMLAGDSRVSGEPGQRRRTLTQAIGLGRGEGPPPTDEDVRRWLEERRLEKYG